MFQLNKKDQNGFSVLLAILIMTSLIITTFALSDVVLRVGRSSRQIGQSEIAYYAAETAVEKALYQIEQNRTVAGLDGETGVLAETGADWEREVKPITSLTIKCGEGEGELHSDEQGICVGVAGDIDDSNPLRVQLNSGSSFQLDLNFQAMAYPDNLQVNWTDPEGKCKLVVSGNDGHYSYSSSQKLYDLGSNLYTLRLVNDSSSMVTFELVPATGASLPIGIKVTGIGKYKGQKRILEVERHNWQIYQVPQVP